jgi:hypothetical protein
MVIASHVVIAAYGFWLPNEQRGSWSDFVRNWELLRFGKATKVETHRSVAGNACDWAKREEARASLMYPAVKFTGRQALAIAVGFADAIRRSGYVILACTILEEHTHLVIGRHEYEVEKVVNRMKGAATRELAAGNLHPLAEYTTKDGKTPSPWSEGLWKVFLDRAEDVTRAVEYTEANAEKEHKRRQTWPFVTPFDVWLNHM